MNFWREIAGSVALVGLLPGMDSFNYSYFKMFKKLICDGTLESIAVVHHSPFPTIPQRLLSLGLHPFSIVFTVCLSDVHSLARVATLASRSLYCVLS